MLHTFNQFGFMDLNKHIFRLSIESIVGQRIKAYQLLQNPKRMPKRIKELRTTSQKKYRVIRIQNEWKIKVKHALNHLWIRLTLLGKKFIERDVDMTRKKCQGEI